MEFHITIRFSGRKQKLIVKRIYQDELTERYVVTDNKTEFIFERTKPVLLHMAIKPGSAWKLIKPRTLFGSAKGDIIGALKKELE